MVSKSKDGDCERKDVTLKCIKPRIVKCWEETALLVGAGFSYPSGIPIMKDLARNFPDALQKEELKTYEQLKSLVPEIEEDFELLLESCYDLIKTPIDLINRLAEQCYGEIFNDLDELVKSAVNLCLRIKEYLRVHCEVKRDNMEYLYPLMIWLKKTGYSFDVFSLNYDLLIETLCEEFFIPYTDGFQLNWDPKLFMDSQYQVRLFKLHGSFIWYQSNLGERVKIPIWNFKHGMEYLTQDDVVSMLVYPRREKKELFEELLRFFRERLLTLRKLVAIGYSFHDEEILSIVEEGLRKNANLHLEIISPNAEELSEFFKEKHRIQFYSVGVEEWVKNYFFGIEN